MRAFVSKIRTVIDDHVDLRGEWLALLFAAVFFFVGLALAFTIPVGR
jgi:hypothetical protein